MVENKKRIISFILAFFVLLGSKFKIKADVYEFDFPKETESDSLDEIKIDSENIKKYIKERYNIENVNNINIRQVISLNLENFNQSDLYELYKFPNLQYLFLKNGNIVDSSFLQGIDNLNLLYLFNCKIDDLSCLKETNITSLDIGNCYLTNELVEYFPSTLRKLRLFKESAINNLSLLPSICPNIQDLSLVYCSGIVNLEFIKELNFLKTIDALETPACTEELLNYIKEKGLLTNLSIEDVNNNKRLVNILESIIDNYMTDEEKVQAICVYIKKNINKFVFGKLYNSHEPLSDILKENKGTCIEFSYLTNVLFNMANINSVDLNYDNHSWNLVCVDDKYYYIDTSEMYDILLDYFNVDIYYMQDPYDVLFSKMERLDKIGLSNDLINKINISNDKKSFIEEHLSNLAANILYFFIISYTLYDLNRNKKNKNKKKIK